MFAARPVARKGIHDWIALWLGSVEEVVDTVAVDLWLGAERSLLPLLRTTYFPSLRGGAGLGTNTCARLSVIARSIAVSHAVGFVVIDAGDSGS